METMLGGPHQMDRDPSSDPAPTRDADSTKDAQIPA